MRLIWADPTLRMLGLATMFFGSVVASLEPYVSLVGISIFGLSDNGFALVLAGSLAVSVVASVWVGIVTDQHAVRKQVAVSCVLLMGLGVGLVAVTGSQIGFILAHVLLIPVGGTILGQIFAVARLQTAGLPNADRDGVTAVIRALFAVPFAVVLPLWGLAFNGGLGLLTLYPVLLAICACFAVLLLARWPRDANAPWSEQKSGLPFFASLREIVAGPVVWRVGWMGAVHSGSTLMGVLLALVFTETAGRSAGDVGVFFGAFVAVEICVMLSVGTLARVMRRLHIIGIGAAFYALFLALLPLMAASPWVWLLILPVAIGGGLIYSLSISYLQDLLGARAGAGASLMALQRMVSAALAAGIFALGSALGGYQIAAFLGAGMILFGMAALLYLDDGPRNRPGNQASKNPGPA